MSARIVPITADEEEEIFAEHHDSDIHQQGGLSIETSDGADDGGGGLSIVGISVSPSRPTPGKALAPAASVTSQPVSVALSENHNSTAPAASDSPNPDEPLPTQNQMEAHEARAMVLSCMDFRLLDDIVEFMNSQGYHNNYDQFILAGASLGYNQQTHPHWGALWTEHLGLALKLHKVKEIICIDHDRCGAYKLFHPEMKPAEERDYHVKNLQCFTCSMSEQYPQLKVSSYFMRLDGSCEKIEG
jgi:hypothetical protein